MTWFWDKKPGKNGPDYSEVDSLEKARQLAQRGELVSILLLPAEFGGEDIPMNTAYVPAFAAELKASTDQNVILPIAMEGKVKRYNAQPEYSGNSFVPVAIRITATDPESLTYTIKIWGEGLNRE